MRGRFATRSCSAMTRGIDQMDRDEWRGMAMRLAAALREVRRIADPEASTVRGDRNWEVIYITADNALENEDLE